MKKKASMVMKRNLLFETDPTASFHHLSTILQLLHVVNSTCHGLYTVRHPSQKIEDTVDFLTLVAYFRRLGPANDLPVVC